MSAADEERIRTWALALASGTMAADELVSRVTSVIAEAVAAEREACAEIAEEVMRLYGSHAAEQVAQRIRARSDA